MSLRFVILYGSVRETRQGIKAACFIVDKLARRGHATTLVDPLEQRLSLLDRMYKEYPKGEAPPVREALAETYRAADGFVIVGRIQSRHPADAEEPARSFLEEYFFRPSAIVCCSAGAFGGVRAAMQLRMTLGELGMPSIPSIFPSPMCRTRSTTAAAPSSRSSSGASAGSSTNSNGTPRRCVEDANTAPRTNPDE